MSRRLITVGLVLCGLVAAKSKIAGDVNTNGNGLVDVIITYTGTPGSFAEAKIKGLSGAVKRELQQFHSIAVRLPAHKVVELENDSTVLHVSLDHPLGHSGTTTSWIGAPPDY